MESYTIDRDVEWFERNNEDLVRRYDGKFLAVRNGEVLAVGDDAADAAVKAGLPTGECLIRLCTLNKNARTLSIYTPGLVCV